MESYIKKAAVVAEIRRRFDEYSSSILKHYDACKEAKAQELGKILTILDTLEEKEVDLEKEINDYTNEHFSKCGDGVLISDANSTELTLSDVTSIARHFFELGLKAQRGG